MRMESGKKNDQILYETTQQFKVQNLFEEAPEEFRGRPIRAHALVERPRSHENRPREIRDRFRRRREGAFGSGYTPVTYFGVAPYEKRPSCRGREPLPRYRGRRQDLRLQERPLNLWPNEDQAQHLAPFDRQGRINASTRRTSRTPGSMGTSPETSMSWPCSTRSMSRKPPRKRVVQERDAREPTLQERRDRAGQEAVPEHQHG